MSQSDYPTTDVEEIKKSLNDLHIKLDVIGNRLDAYVQAINGIGGNLNWLVENTQGIFQMFASPQFISQMSNMIAGGIASGGQNPGPDTGPDTEPG